MYGSHEVLAVALSDSSFVVARAATVAALAAPLDDNDDPMINAKSSSQDCTVDPNPTFTTGDGGRTRSALAGAACDLVCRAAPLAFGIGWRALGGTPLSAAMGTLALHSFTCLTATHGPVSTAAMWSVRMFMGAGLCAALTMPLWFSWNIWLVAPVSLFVPSLRCAYLDMRHAFLAVALGTMTVFLARSWARFASHLPRKQ